MSFIRFLFTIFIILISLSSKIFAFENKILFKVNNEIITSIDILNEANYLKIINRNIGNLKKNEIYEISKKSLIKEKIKKTEVLRISKNFNFKNEVVEKIMLNYLKNLNIDNIEELKNYLDSNNLNFNEIKEKILINVLWNRIIYEKFSNNLKIDEDKIKEELSKNKIQKEYLLSEIVFSVDDKKNLDKKYNDIKVEINKNGFTNAVLLFSISETAKDSGNLGWIKETLLSPKIKEEIQKMGNTSVSKPIQVPGGFLIFRINDTRSVKVNINVEQELKTLINLKRNEQLNQFSNIYFQKIQKDIVINEF